MTAQTGVEVAVGAALTDMQGRVVIGYSGGLDSTVLLHATAEMIADRRHLLALHVNHGLSSHADAWERHCEAVGARLGVACVVRRVGVAATGSREAAARRARYAAFADLLDAIDVLWLAHHLDDQAETVLWRLMRGGGTATGAGMPASRRIGRGRLVRPLLDITRQEISAWALARGLRWIDDDSNLDPRHERNFIRHRVMPVLQAQWPDAAARLRDAARRAMADADALRRAMDRELDAGGARADRLPVSSVAAGVGHALLRRWLERRGVRGVRERVLEEIVRQSRSAPDRVPQVGVGGGFCVRRYEDQLFLVAEVAREFAATAWTLDHALPLPAGCLTATREPGRGLRGDLACVEVRARRGGERLRPPRRDGSRSVKRLLLDARVPPWLRVAYPLVYVDGQLAAVPGVAVDAAFADDSRHAWQLRFDTAPCAS